MSKRAMYDLKEKLCEELDEIARKDDMSAGDLEAAHKLTDTIKNILKIDMLEDDGEYSRAGEWEAKGRFGDNYDRDSSYRGGRHRDSMGRYSRADDDYSMRRGRRYSRGGDVMEHIDMAIQEAETDGERRMLEEFKEKMKRYK